LSSPLLELKNLCVERGGKSVLEDFSCQLGSGRTVGWVGESGSGKTSAALALMRCLEPTSVVKGQVLFEGKDLLSTTAEGLRELRGAALALMLQDPFLALHPILRIGEQLTETVRAHEPSLGADAVRARVVETLASVELPEPDPLLRAYPHQLSGGMRQRVLLAQALVCRPRLLIADEPTTGVDPVIRKQLLQLLDRLRKERSMALILISHDLAAVEALCEQLAVFHRGRCVKQGPTEGLMEALRSGRP
jgi:ABC-type glutathione transport system ATPase component